MAPAGRSNRRGRPTEADYQVHFPGKRVARGCQIGDELVELAASLSRRSKLNRPATVGNLRVGDSHGRRLLQVRAVGVERRPVHSLVAVSACPGGVSAAVPETRLMAYEHFAEAEGVPVGMVLVDAGEVDLPTRSRLEIDR